jgi:hypothetical protein
VLSLTIVLGLYLETRGSVNLKAPLLPLNQGGHLCFSLSIGLIMTSSLYLFNESSIYLVQLFPVDLLLSIPHAMSLFYQRSGVKDRGSGGRLGNGGSDPTSSTLILGNHVTAKPYDYQKWSLCLAMTNGTH